MQPFDLTNDEITIVICALEYFQRDLDEEELTAGGAPVTSEEIDAILDKFEALYQQ